MSLILPQRGRVSIAPQKAIDIIGSLGLTSGLSVCLDAGDSDSYSSGYKWLDVSGNGQDWYCGTSTSGDGAEPTFNGTPGGLSSSEYWGFDGGDYFLYDTSNETWMENLHKDNTLHSIAFWFFLASATDFPLVSTANNAGSVDTGYYLYIYGSIGIPALIVRNGSGTVLQAGATSGSFSTGAWAFVGVSMDEAAGTNGLVFNVNGTTSYRTSTYSSPSSGAAQMNPMRIGADLIHFIPNGSRLAQFYAWGGTAIGAGALNSIFQQTRSRYGV